MDLTSNCEFGLIISEKLYALLGVKTLEHSKEEKERYRQQIMITQKINGSRTKVSIHYQGRICVFKNIPQP